MKNPLRRSSVLRRGIWLDATLQVCAYFADVLVAAPQQGPSGQHAPAGQHDALVAALVERAVAATQHAPSGQHAPAGQHDALVATLVLVVAAQHGPSGQHTPSGQHDPFALVVSSARAVVLGRVIPRAVPATSSPMIRAVQTYNLLRMVIL